MADTDITIKELERLKRRENYLKNKERILANNAKSRAKNREKILQGKRDYYNRIKNDPEWQAKDKAKRLLNKEKKSQYDKKYHAANKDKKVKRAIKWNEENKLKRSAITFNYDSKRRAITKSGCSTKEIKHWKDSQKKVCYWCGVRCSENYHVDHYVPLAKGGKHEIDNLVISCAPCNLRKNMKDPIEFANSVGRLF